MRTVLLAEDDLDDCVLTRKALQAIDPDIDVIMVRTGREALDRVAGGLRPTVMLLDLNMPVLDGREMLSALQLMQPRPAFPIFVFTTSTEDFERRECLQRGATGFIPKPTSLRSYIDILNTHLVDYLAYGTTRSSA